MSQVKEVILERYFNLLKQHVEYELWLLDTWFMQRRSTIWRPGWTATMRIFRRDRMSKRVAVGDSIIWMLGNASWQQFLGRRKTLLPQWGTNKISAGDLVGRGF